mgnify:CR=1 FL=1
MGFWSNVRELFTSRPDAPQEDRSHTSDPFSVSIIDGVAVPGIGMMGAPNYRRGMSIPAGWRCATLLSELLGGVPWHVYRESNGRAERLSPTPPLIERPDPRPNTSRMDTMSSWALDLLWEGNAVGLVAARDAEGWPTAALPIPTRVVGVRRVQDNSLLPAGAVEYSIGGRVFSGFDVIHVKGPHEPGAVRGMGVLEAHFAGIDLSHELRRQASNIAQNGVPTGKITLANPDATRADMVKAKQQWLEAQRDRTVAVLNSGMDFEPLSWNPEEMQLVEARKFDLLEWALIFGMPLRLLGVEQTSRTYQNVEHENTELLRFTMGGHLARFEQTLSLHRPRGQFVKANLDGFLRSDTSARYEAHATGIGAGFLTVDEVREIEDLPPLPPRQALPQTPDSSESPGEEDDDE